MMNEYSHEKFLELTPESINFRDTMFISCTFLHCDLTEVKGINATLEDCTFIECNLSLTDFTQAHLQNVHFKNCKVLGINFTKANPFGLDISFSGSMVQNCNFCHLNLKKTHFSDCRISESDFIGSDLRESHFRNTVFQKVQFHQCNLEKADFSHAMGYEINPFNNQLKNAKFSMPEAVSFLDYLGIKLTD